MRREIYARDRYFLDKACEIAAISECRQRHGAIIVKAGKPIGMGINSYNNEPEIFDDCCCLNLFSTHAEIAAIRSCRKNNLKGATIYVARINRQGEKRLSKPCPDCAKAIADSGIRKVFYTIQE